jgi:L-arabinonolactonase
MDQAKLVLDCQNLHGEGVFWSSREQKLYWTDIKGQQVWCFDPETQASQHYDLDERLCAFALRKDGSILAAFASGIALYHLRTKEREDLYAFEPELSTTRLNDGRVDRQGRFVVGGIDESDDGASISRVIRVNQDFSIDTLLSDVACANSICFSPDGKTMYFADTPKQTILGYSYCDQGLGARFVLSQCHDGPGFPDGSTVDNEGYLWNAKWNGACVTRYSSKGKLDKVIEVPVPNPTCVALGGKHLDTLFITTSRQMMSDDMLLDRPNAGGLFAIKVSTKGIEEPEFG